MQLTALCKSRFLAGRFIKTVMVMKITVFLVLVASMNVSAKVYSQKLTLTEKNASLDKLFTEIKKQTGYTFVYTESILKKAKNVSLQVVDASLQNVLDICLHDQPFTYEIIEKTIVIKPISEPSAVVTSPIPIDISGIVIDHDGRPLSGVSVVVKGFKLGTETDANGVFKLSGVSASAVLIFSSVGYEKQEIAASANSIINVTM